jgi:hypothetical protein
MGVDLDNQIFACMIFRVGEYTSEPLGYVIGTKKYIEDLTDPTEDLVPMCRAIEFSGLELLKELF